MSAITQRPNELRAFFAIELDNDARKAADEVAQVLRPKQPKNAVRWVEPANFHVTLRFLGNIDPDGIEALLIQVENELEGAQSFELALSSSHAFPQTRPRGVVLGLDPAEPIAELAAAVDRGAVACGHRRDKRSFKSHLTLGRVRRGVKARDLQFEGESPNAVLFPVREVVLFRSQLTQEGPQYTALERIALGAS